MTGELTQTEFADSVESGTLAMTIVGMSNAGKSRWAKRLAAQHDFEHFCCDDLIEGALDGELREQGFEGGIKEMSRWLGQPYDPQFPANEATYLELETAKMAGIIGRLRGGTDGRNTVVDTTGSVVHTSPKICRELGEVSLVVCIFTQPSERQEMFERFLAEPKPVVWGDVYARQDGESRAETLARCYPNLLQHRSELYLTMADVVVPRGVLRALPEEADSGEFLNIVQELLPA